MRFTKADVDRARAASVLIEYGDEEPLVVDPADMNVATVLRPMRTSA